MRTFLFYILLALQVTLVGQDINLKVDFSNYNVVKEHNFRFLNFDGASFNEDYIPYYRKSFKDVEIIKYQFTVISSTALTQEELKLIKSEELRLEITINKTGSFSGSKYFSSIEIFPFFIRNGIPSKITKGNLTIVTKKKSKKRNTNRTLESIENSVLEKGTWFKFAITKSGIYSITYKQLLELGILSSAVEKTQIGIYSNEAGALPFLNGEESYSDLRRLPLKYLHNEDILFNEGDVIHFYGEANGSSNLNFVDTTYSFSKNIYSDTNYVYLNVRESSNLLVSNQTNVLVTDTLYDFPKLIHNENEWTNFIKSGRTWVGEPFLENPLSFSYPYSAPLKWQNKSSVKFKACARSSYFLNNKVSLIFDSDTIASAQFSKVSPIYYNDYVKFSTAEASTSTNNQLTRNEIEFYYHQPSNPLAWLDYFTFTSFQRLKTYNNDQLVFQLPNSNEKDLVDIRSDWTSAQVWDVTHFDEVKNQPIIQTDSSFQIKIERDTIKKYVIFNNSNIYQATYEGPVGNQNLHAANSVNYLIITVPKFENQAKALIKLHQEKDNLTGAYFFTEDIYNEYASGKDEPAAIRNFIKSLYDKGINTDNQLQYVLLLGDGSYDNKNRLNNNRNWIPTFQSANSVKLTNSYVTDDFYGLMDDGEGDYENGDLLDIAIGRLPVNYTKEADDLVQKISEYYDLYDKTNASQFESKLLTSKGAWKNNILFVADDEDYNEHMRQANLLSATVDTSIKKFNIKKVFLDAFLQESTSFGQTSTQANKKLIENIKNGALVINYTGHGGELGWTEEQIFLVKDIRALENRNKLPLLMTATCEFSRFDNPEHTSAGEYLLLQPQGGAIALFTTVRLVFSIPNFRLNQTFYTVLKESISQEEIRLGDIFKGTKVRNNGGTNDRNFTLLGDPALKLSFPLFNINTSSITTNETPTDTLKSLDLAILKGSITDDQDNKIINYNGWLEVRIFDKKKSITTLNNDNLPTSFVFDQQEELLFKGRTKVINGDFEVEVFIPEKIRLDYGFGRISYYAVDSVLGDAAGYYDSVIIGGVNKNALDDKIGPEVQIFLEDSSFNFGDPVSKSPLFIAEIFDSSGVNLVSNELGKNLTLVIDDRTDLTYNVTDFYTPSEQSFRLGEVLFPLDELSTGRHNLTFKAYDNQNNSSKAYTEFIIEENAKLALNYLLNYPNPFTTNTGFYFEHNQIGSDLKVLITIFSLSGKAIKTIDANINNATQRVGPIEWDGLDDFGDEIGRGVYIYKLEVLNSQNEKESEIQKLVILK